MLIPLTMEGNGNEARTKEVMRRFYFTHIIYK